MNQLETRKCQNCHKDMTGYSSLFAKCPECRNPKPEVVEAVVEEAPIIEEPKDDTKATFQQIRDLCEKASDKAAYAGDAKAKAQLVSAMKHFGNIRIDEHFGSRGEEQVDFRIGGRMATLAHQPKTGKYGKDNWYVFYIPGK